MARIRVLVVDDSVVVRKILCDTLTGESDFEVVGTAADGRLALEQIDATKPDVVTLDIEMPVMDGVAAAGEIHRRWPRLPVIMFSTLSQRGATTTLEALGAGAVDYVTKPTNSANLLDAMRSLREDLFAKLRFYGGRSAAARVAAQPVRAPAVPASPPAPSAEEPCTNAAPKSSDDRTGWRPPAAPARDDAQRKSFRERLARLATSPPAVPSVVPPAAGGAPVATPKPPPRAPFAANPRSRLMPGEAPEVVVIGVSTGGPPALNVLLPALPATFPVPILIVQHMPPIFTKLLAQQLAAKCQLKVVEAEAGMSLEPGVVAIAPGDFHMVIERSGTQHRIALHQEAPENSCRPSVDPLFRSAARCFGRRTLGVVLTGMGSDGMKGSQAIKEAGGVILAQDENSSVVWGMPGYVVNQGLADAVLALDMVAAELLCRVPGCPLPSKVPVSG
jgi:two-component system chemotaxis response regulator CheB